MPIRQDEVDRRVAAWRRELPDLDVRPLELLIRLSHLAHDFDRVRRGLFSATGCRPASVKC